MHNGRLLSCHISNIHMASDSFVGMSRGPCQPAVFMWIKADRIQDPSEGVLYPHRLVRKSPRKTFWKRSRWIWPSPKIPKRKLGHTKMDSYGSLVAPFCIGNIERFSDSLVGLSRGLRSKGLLLKGLQVNARLNQLLYSGVHIWPQFFFP